MKTFRKGQRTALMTEVKARVKLGWNLTQIARHFGCSCSTASHWCRIAGVKPFRRPGVHFRETIFTRIVAYIFHHPLETNKEVAFVIDCSKSYVEGARRWMIREQMIVAHQMVLDE